MPDRLHALETEVARFRTWADENPERRGEQPGSWETYSPHWGALSSAIWAFVSATPHADWSEDTADMLLYAIARDNEIMGSVREIARNPDGLLFLAERAVTSAEPDAKSQIAWRLGQLGQRSPQVEALLLRLVHDDSEWVRRQALTALFVLESPSWPELAEAAWDAGGEWQRVDILHALHLSNSPDLNHYLELADADGRPNVCEHAEQIRASLTK